MSNVRASASGPVKPITALILVGLAGACASSRAGSKPVPTHAIEVAADTKIPDAGDAAAPSEDGARASVK